jgi:hypothetical protein
MNAFNNGMLSTQLCLEAAIRRPLAHIELCQHQSLDHRFHHHILHHSRPFILEHLIIVFVIACNLYLLTLKRLYPPPACLACFSPFFRDDGGRTSSCSIKVVLFSHIGVFLFLFSLSLHFMTGGRKRVDDGFLGLVFFWGGG